jgi:chemotaxis protein MotB
MRSFVKWLGLAAVGASLTGCVSSQQYKQVVAERDSLRQELSTVRSEADEYKNQLGAITEASATKDEQITSLSTQNSELQAQLDEINRQYAEVLERANNPLPAALAGELSEFATANKDIIDFDSTRGMVKFKSDLSFPAGSVELTPKAKDAIAKLSKILNERGVADYQLMIAGHTDAVAVNRPETVKAGHKDNWYLSAHRAIAVGKALQSHQVSAHRLAMVGYADQRPVASNATEDGRAKNRRVELLIMPVKAEQANAEWLKTGKKTASKKTTTSSEKDANVKTDSGPAFNK